VNACLLRLARAVQRASIYPPGHPAVSHGVGPLADALADLLHDGPVSIAVGRTRLLVSGGGNPPTEHESPWLAARLFDREVAVLEISTEFDAAEASRLVSWLSSADDAGGGLPAFAGVRLSRFDGASVRFKDRGAGGAATPEADIAWHVLTAPLRRAYGPAGDDGALVDPRVLADRIRQAIHAVEGVGIAALSQQLVEVHGAMAPLDAEARAAATANLAALIDGLSPELRGTLLATSDADEDGKIALVEALLPLVPPAVLDDIVANVTVSRAPVRGPFARFLRTLARMAARDPAVSEAFHGRLDLAGVPASLVRGDDDEEHGSACADREPPSEPSGADDFVPADYGARLEHLATAPRVPTARAAIVTDAFADAALGEHLSRIALLQVKADLTGPDAVTYLRCLADMLPRAFASATMVTIAGAADVVLRLRAASARLSPELRASLGALERLFAEPSAVAMAIRLVTGAPIGADPASATLLLAGGSTSAQAALEWMRTAPEDDGRVRVAAALMALDVEVFKRTIAPTLGENRRASEAFVSALERADPSQGIEIALLLTAHDVADMRRRAVAWLFGVPLSPARLQRVLQHALGDREPRIVALALEFAARRHGATTTEAVLGFVARRVSADLLPLQTRAVHIAADAGGEAAARLAGLLGQRGYLCGALERRLSVAMAGVLGRSADASARTAARAWRWSPAGLLSLFTRPAEFGA
jgi:phage baseplate assembly protein W